MKAVFRQQPCWRVIPSRAPSQDLFQGIADFGEWEAVAEIEQLWSEPVRGVLGNLGLIPKAQRALGSGSTFIMASYAYLSPTRFSSGDFGVLYAGLDKRTALVEVAFHRARFLRDSGNPRETLDHQVLGLTLSAELEDIRDGDAAHAALYDPDHYGVSQSFGADLRAKGADGIVYDSVRNRGGHCVAGFRPNAFANCRHMRPIQFAWDGAVLYGPDGIKA